MSEKRKFFIQIALFVVTFITTTHAGSEWSYGRSILYTPDYSWSDFFMGMEFSIPFLLILTVHEFGHYFTAMYHRVRATLPYYIPMPPLPFSIGTLGAVIRLKQRVFSKKQNFDIGLAGPLAGFIVSLVVLFYGFLTLPEPEYIFSIHPEYQQYGLDYAEHVYQNQGNNAADITVGKNLLFLFFEKFVADPARVPNPHEIIHYPVIFAGFLSLIFTFMNLLPFGQLDGGHIAYGLFGFRLHRLIASFVFVAFIFYAGLGYISPREELSSLVWSVPGMIAFLFFALTGLGLSRRDTLMYALLMFASQFTLAWLYPTLEGYPGWLLFGFLIGRFVGIPHPPSEIEEPLDAKRIVLGWLSLVIFVICFTPQPLVITVPEPSEPTQHESVESSGTPLTDQSL